MQRSTRALALVLTLATPAAAEADSGLPDHLKRWPGLYVRSEQRIVEAPPEDQAVARGYASFRDKGALRGGLRLTLMTKKTRYAPGEEIRVIHVLEAPGPGLNVYVMGPKFVHGESVDGAPISGPPPSPAYPFLETYDGAVLKSPAADYNYDVTSYRFTEPGTHVIGWQLGALRSNTITVEIGEGPSGPAGPAPLFQYSEDSDTVQFLAPRSVRLVRSAGGTLKVCQYALSDHGNMWSGPEVEKAFRAAEVQSALAPAGAPFASDAAGKLAAGERSLVWASACKKCRAPSAPLQHLRGLLRTVMLNARLVCK